MNKQFSTFINNVLLLLVPAYFIRFVIWFITLKINTGPEIIWKESSYSALKKLFIPNIFAQDHLLYGLLITFLITISAWLLCIMLSSVLSSLSFSFRTLRVPVGIILWLSNFHLFFGFLVLFFLWGENIEPDWLWAALIVVLCNGSLQSMTKKFIEQMDQIFTKRYVLFAESQGISKWRAGIKELSIKIIYCSIELLPFFLLSTIIIELVFERLRGLGSILLDNIKNIIDNSYDRIDEIFMVVLLLIAIVRIIKLISDWLESELKIN